MYTNKETVQTSLSAAGGFTLGTSYYWSSSQYASNNYGAYYVDFDDGFVDYYGKSSKYDVCVLQAFNVEQFNNDYGVPSITSVTIPNVGEGYTGELPVTIIGENLIGHAITCDDASFGNVTYLTDSKVTATFVYNGSNNTITVTSGTSSAIGTVKVVESEKCFTAGDILFTDGTIIKAENVQYGIPDSQLPKAFAVIASVSCGGGVGKAVGLQKSSSTLKWAPSGTTGYNTNFAEIQATSSGYTFSGDMDGSDNWELICKVDPEGTKGPATNYPVFNFAFTYGTQAGLTGTDYENGWYVPSVAELYDVYKNKESVQTSLSAAGGFELGTSNYWSSSQHASSSNYAYYVYFGNGLVDYYNKDFSKYAVCVLQAFNVEQFNNYEYGTPSITSVTVANAGEGYTGEIPVTIIGENLKGHAITCSDASFSNVNYVSDNMIKATVNCNGVVGESAITVTSGTSSASCTVKVVEVEKCFTVGDIVFTDGTIIKAENVQYGIPDSQKEKVFAVIASAPYGGGVGKAVGLQRSSSTLKWAPSGTTGYDTNFTGIQGTKTSGDMDGSDNWEYICSIDPEGTKDPANNYPAFNFALTYGTTAGLTGTEYENGWYVPSVAELYDVYTNKETVQTSLTAVGGFALGTSAYWSSSQTQYASNSNYAYNVDFDDGYVSDTVKDTRYNVLVLQAFNAEQFNKDEYKTPSITSVTIANVGEGYTGELPVTITGTNLKGHAITCDDATFGNVTYLTDSKVTATFVYNGSNNTITVTSETSSAAGTVKVVESEKCFTAGDILFTDGTIIKAENVQYGIPDSQLPKAFAVIASAPYGGGVGKAVGLQRSSTTLMWAKDNTTGYNTNFAEIQASSSGYTFTGDFDGSDNWEAICKIDSTGTLDAAANYPALNFALSYGTTAGLTGTEYENGWYVPSLAELYDMSTNTENVQNSLTAVGGFDFGNTIYWSSSQNISCYYYSYGVNVKYGNMYSDSNKNYYNYVLVLQDFNGEQFTNYEYEDASIVSVTVQTVGEEYSGKVPVTITGTNLKGHTITCDDVTFGNVKYVSDKKVTALISYSGIVGESTITVKIGSSRATGIVKVIATKDCFTVGDILCTDGTRIKAENVQDGLTDSQRFNAFAVVTSVSYEGGVGKAVGLQKSPSTLRWAKSNTTGYNTNFTEIQGTVTSGDMDGSDNWEYICSIDPEGTLDPATNYPAFNFALTYGTTVGLTGTDYENGWYVPTIAELNGIYVKKDIIQTSLTAVNGFEIVSNYWLSSSQYELDNDDVYIMYSSGSVNFTWKDDGKYVLVLQAFNAEQFN